MTKFESKAGDKKHFQLKLNGNFETEARHPRIMGIGNVSSEIDNKKSELNPLQENGNPKHLHLLNLASRSVLITNLT